MDPKLQAIIDRDDIWQVMLRYSRGIDRFDRVLLRSCYHDDAIDDHASFIGRPDEFIDWAIGYHTEHNTVHHHSISNHYCELEDGIAHAETYYSFMAGNKASPHTLAMGRYVDRLEKRTGEWRIADRVCVTELVCDVPGSAIPDAYARLLFSNGPATRDATDVSYMRPLRARRPSDAGQ